MVQHSSPTEPAPPSEGLAYVARKACGCVTLVTVDNPAHAADVARDVASCIRRGDSVERLPIELARAALTDMHFGPCPHDLAKAAGTS